MVVPWFRSVAVEWGEVDGFRDSLSFVDYFSSTCSQDFVHSTCLEGFFLIDFHKNWFILRKSGVGTGCHEPRVPQTTVPGTKCQGLRDLSGPLWTSGFSLRRTLQSGKEGRWWQNWNKRWSQALGGSLTLSGPLLLLGQVQLRTGDLRASLFSCETPQDVTQPSQGVRQAGGIADYSSLV